MLASLSNDLLWIIAFQIDHLISTVSGFGRCGAVEISEIAASSSTFAECPYCSPSIYELDCNIEQSGTFVPARSYRASHSIPLRRRAPRW